jgi:hypothetical protein
MTLPRTVTGRVGSPTQPGRLRVHDLAIRRRIDQVAAQLAALEAVLLEHDDDGLFLSEAARQGCELWAARMALAALERGGASVAGTSSLPPTADAVAGPSLDVSAELRGGGVVGPRRRASA